MIVFKSNSHAKLLSTSTTVAHTHYNYSRSVAGMVVDEDSVVHIHVYIRLIQPSARLDFFLRGIWTMGNTPSGIMPLHSNNIHIAISYRFCLSFPERPSFVSQPNRDMRRGNTARNIKRKKPQSDTINTLSCTCWWAKTVPELMYGIQSLLWARMIIQANSIDLIMALANVFPQTSQGPRLQEL